MTDARSYSNENFQKVIVIHEKKQLQLNSAELARFKQLTLALKEVEQLAKEEEAAIDDAPEEFMDPITAALMEDPVLMPTSNMIVDRSTIETHLISDPTDPFNRAKLTTDMLIPCPDLKEKIELFKEKCKKI